MAAVNIKKPTSKTVQVTFIGCKKVVDAIRELDNKRPILLVSDGIEMELNNWEILPYNIEGINSYGFTYFSRTLNELNKTALKQYANFYRKNIHPP